ncbi:UTP--glucose-1-phosphate uridylyltransferase GalU [Candidatus Peregrinibacteria bacterium]|nr:UTP--glucose-1-phosphate uridylyltransferase GalU [Candidatus Peregrinibacteria bacterium]
MKKRIRKAIFPAAGFGTRFLPFTKAMPKEMLPIVDKPVIQYLVEEAVQSGIEEIIIITGRGKRAIEDHFDTSFELEHTLVENQKLNLLKEVRGIENLAKFVYVRQNRPLGDGHALLCARELINDDEPFAVLFGDDIIDSKIPAIKQLMEAYEKTKSMIIGVQEVHMSDISSYGVVDPAPNTDTNDMFLLRGMVEKPSPKSAPSNLGIIGKYICTPEIFGAIEKAEKSRDGELRLIDGFRYVIGSHKIYAKKISGTRYDTGGKIGFLKATIDFALKRDDLGPALRKHLREKYK